MKFGSGPQSSADDDERARQAAATRGAKRAARIPDWAISYWWLLIIVGIGLVVYGALEQKDLLELGAPLEWGVLALILGVGGASVRFARWNPSDAADPSKWRSD